MAAGPRSYSAGVERALFRLAKGTCYFPECSRNVMTLVEGLPVVDVEIAHIRGAKEGSARYDPAMSDEQRAAFTNLILLCGPHHKLVDRLRPLEFSPEILASWKRANEPEDGISALASSGLTDKILEGVMVQLVAATKPMRELEVDLVAGIIINSTKIMSMGDLASMAIILEANEVLRRSPKVLIADIRNVGTLPVSVEDLELWVIFGEDPDAPKISLLGRNDFGLSNPTLPYRLQDGASVHWYTKLQTVSDIVLTASIEHLVATGVRAHARLSSGETVKSSTLAWRVIG